MLILASFCIASCALLPGDGAFRVSGVIVDAQGASLHGCNLSLHRAENERNVKTEKVNSEFDETFIISPSRKKYFMIVDCDGFKYKTSVMELGDPKYFREPINLGRVVIDKTANKNVNK